ncbi:M20 metallopeptidase family protein [Clostridium pasteurianum]|uniref:Amidohydrolase n=1 Tax=Clostridium pasteurianum BC1 TaxID=86416 RepID=R4K8T0_CLOPA|nr:amidohydrolase [Clostridium pasteurianum]AGK98106.1 amidohydrolase [Clostridium pasteurianum BC1]
MNFLNEANKIKDQLIAWRRDFHSHPELDYELFRTNEKIKAFLEGEGIEYRIVAKTGICAIIKGAKSGKTIALRGDMDALPLQDEKKCEYASKVNGKMHACGHDAHTTILMGAAKLLNAIKGELSGNIKLFFEPAEETTGGARLMIAEGVLENPKVDAVIGLHVDEAIEVGKIGVKKDVVNAASNPFTIKIKGKGGHGAHPDTTVDPIVISCNVVNALQTIISRELPPVDPGVITIGYIHGGTAQNIIPEEVKIGGIIRTMKTEHRSYVKKRLREIAEGIVTSMRGSCEIEIEESYPCLYNDDEMLNVVKESAEEVIGKDKINILQNPSMGVESFAYFSLERPSAFYYLGCRNEARGIVNPAHGSLFDVDEACIPIGVAIQCTAAVNYLQKNN